MSDLLFVAIMVGFFLLAALFVHGCDRIIGVGIGADEEAPADSATATEADREQAAA